MTHVGVGSIKKNDRLLKVRAPEKSVPVHPLGGDILMSDGGDSAENSK